MLAICWFSYFLKNPTVQFGNPAVLTGGRRSWGGRVGGIDSVCYVSSHIRVWGNVVCGRFRNLRTKAKVVPHFGCGERSEVIRF